MKNQIKTMAAALLMSALFANTALAATGKEPADFIVNGLILKTNKNLDSKCKLELFQENTLIESSEIKMNKVFERKLKKNVWYTIRITKDGYKPLLISFNTELKNDAEVLDNLFEFETALIDNEAARFMDKDQLEFPVGVVAFNAETQKFEARDVYTKNYMTTLYRSVPDDTSDLAVVYSAANHAMPTADIAKENVSHRVIGAGMC